MIPFELQRGGVKVACDRNFSRTPWAAKYHQQQTTREAAPSRVRRSVESERRPRDEEEEAAAC